jgi:hypothetical protein
MTARWKDPQASIGDLMPGQSLFQTGVSDEIIDRGIPYSRIYDPVEELGRLRQIYAREAARRPRPAGANAFHHRSLRRGV